MMEVVSAVSMLRAWFLPMIGATLVVAGASGQETRLEKWDERETRLANEYLSLLVERPEYGRVVELLWSLYAKHDATGLLLENIRAQAAASNHPSVVLVEAHLLRKSGDLKMAATRYDEVLKALPDNRFALRARADVANESKQPEQALAILRKLADSLPDGDAEKPGIWLEIGNLALAIKRNEEAARAWETAASLKAGDFGLARQVGESLLRAGYPDRAAAFFEKLAHQADPQKRLEALYDLARVHEHADQFAKADEAVIQALGLLHFRDGRYGEFFLRRVRLHERFGALDDLKDRLLAEARKSPPSEKALSDLVRFFQITVDVDEEIKWLRELVKLAPDTGEYRWLLVRALLDHEGAEEASRLIDQKLQGDGRDMPAVVLLRCEAALRMGKTDEAVLRLKQLLQAAGQDLEVEKQVLVFAQDKSLDDVVETILKQRVARDPSRPEAVFELAGFYRNRRNADEMAKLLDRFASQAPDGAVRQRRLNDIAAFISSGNDLDAAIIAARKAAASPVAGREEWVRLAELLGEQGETDEAIQLLEKAWSKCTSAEERTDVDERLLSLLIGERQEDAAKKKASSGDFQLPSIITGTGFAAADDEDSKKSQIPPAVTTYARKLIDASLAGIASRGKHGFRRSTAARTAAGDNAIMRAAWWAYRADLIEEAYGIMGLLVFDDQGRRRADLSVEAEKLLFDIAVADQNPVLMMRQLKTLAERDPANRVRHLLRLSEVVMEGGQKDDSAVRTLGLGGREAGDRRSPVEDAASILERALKEHPDSEMLLSALSQCYAIMRQPEKALKIWEEGAQRAEGAAAIPLLERRADLLLRMQRVQDYIATEVDIVDRQPEIKRRRETFQRFMDRLLFSDSSGGELAPSVLRDRLRMVEQVLQERMRRHPFDGFYHEALAQIYERGGDPAKAFAEMKQAYYTAPETPFSLDQLRAAALRVGDLKSAIYFQKQIAASASARDEAAESRQLVQLLEQTFQIAEADRVRRRLENRFAQDAKALADLAAHYRTTGQDEAERRVYEQIARVHPWDSQALLRLALKCLSVADDGSAEKHLQRLIATTQPARISSPVDRWPLPLIDERKPSDAAAVTEITGLLDAAPGLERAETDRLRAWLSLPRPEFAELPQDASLVRLRAIEEMGRLVREQAADARTRWVAQWQKDARASPVEKLWALYYGGAHAEFRQALRAVLQSSDALEMQFALAWLTIRSHGMADALAWAGEKERSDAVLQQRRQLIVAIVAMLADADVDRPAAFDAWRKDGGGLIHRRDARGFQFRPGDLGLFGHSRLARNSILLDITRKLQDKQRYGEALALGECLRSVSVGLEGDYAFLLSRIAEGAERWDLQRHYLEEVAAAPVNAAAYSGIYDPFLLSLGALQRVAESDKERKRILQDAWERLQKAPPSPVTSIRRAVVTGLAGATDPAAKRLESFISGDFLSSRQFGERAGALMPQGSARTEEALHLRTFWEDAREIGASLNQHGLGSVVASTDERLFAKWGGVLLGPRSGYEFNEWRLNQLIRRLRDANYPTRLRLIREHLASVDMKQESAVDVLSELGGRLEANGMAREAVEIYRRLPERAPVNSDYAVWLLRACETSLDIEPGLGFSLKILLAEPPLKPPQPGDELLREKHAHFMALNFDVDGLRERGFLERTTKVLQGRIPPEVPYLRELGLLLERMGDSSGALAAWERLHHAFVSNADQGLQPDTESCLHRARIASKQGNARRALDALRAVLFKDPLEDPARDALKLRATLAAQENLWDEFRQLMLIAVDRKSVEVVLSLAGDLHKHGRTAEALSFLTQAERTLKTDADRFRLRLEQLRLLASDPTWNPERGRPQVAALFRASSRDAGTLRETLEWLKTQAAGPNSAAWVNTLRTEARAGVDRPLAAMALTAFARRLPDPAALDEFIAAWRGAQDADRICLDLAARTLLDESRPQWAWHACKAAAEIPSARLQGRKLPVMASVAAALEDRHSLAEIFADVIRMPFPGGNQTVEWAQAFEEAGQPGLCREILETALNVLRQRQQQQPDILKAWIGFLIRQRDFEAAESALVRESYLFINDAARLVFSLYRDWDRLARLDQELPKFFLPSGVEKEVRFLAAQHKAGTSPASSK